MTQATQEKPIEVEVDDSILTQDDVPLLVQRERLRLKLKKLDEVLKPRIKATVEALGTGVFLLGSSKVTLGKSARSTVSWKSLAYSLADELEVDAVKPCFTETSVSYSAKPTK